MNAPKLTPATPKKPRVTKKNTANSSNIKEWQEQQELLVAHFFTDPCSMAPQHSIASLSRKQSKSKVDSQPQTLAAMSAPDAVVTPSAKATGAQKTTKARASKKPTPDQVTQANTMQNQSPNISSNQPNSPSSTKTTAEKKAKPPRAKKIANPPAQPPLEILSVASEMYPLIKTGGLADVVGALPRALQDQQVHVTTLLPAYPSVKAKVNDIQVIHELPHYFGGAASILKCSIQDIDLLLLDAPHLYERVGNPYSDASGHDWQDNADRFAALSMCAAIIAMGCIADYNPSIVHAHDWQTALTPAYLHYLSGSEHRPKTILTIHNLAFQGQFPSNVFDRLGLPAHAFSMEGVEYYGAVGFLKAGINFADAITTVSPSYAQEICGPEAGMGLDGLLRNKSYALRGILNGIDTQIWSPRTDLLLNHRYDEHHLEDRQLNKKAVEEQFGLPHSDQPLFCIISRLTWQKGIDLVVDSIDMLVSMNARLVVLGTGDRGLEAALFAAASRHPQHIAVRIDYNESLSHLLQGGCDGILVPSRFEPCGLTQLYGLHYGCVPIVSQVGGLADTVIDANAAAIHAGVATGIIFPQVNHVGFQNAMIRAISLYKQPDVWKKMQIAGMASDVAWTRSAVEYAQLYRSFSHENTSA